MRRALFLILFALPLAATEREPIIQIVSANDTTVTYRERLPLRVAMDPAEGVYHSIDCPFARNTIQRVSPAAAQLKGLKAHACAKSAKHEYKTQTVRRRPRDPKTIAVLFLGNSLTYFNEIPRVTQDIAEKEARPIRADAVTKGGASLDYLWTDTIALKKLWLEHWDYVVIQERGGLAPYQRGELFHQYLGMFTKEVRRSGAQPLLYMTWWTQRAADNEKVFVAAAKRSGARLVPAGAAWNELARSGETLVVDEIHPNAAGAYLVAATVFSVIYNKPAPSQTADFRHLASPTENYDISLRKDVIARDRADRIRAAAWKAVQRLK